MTWDILGKKKNSLSSLNREVGYIYNNIFLPNTRKKKRKKSGYQLERSDGGCCIPNGKEGRRM
jgi:hypothetical protein